VAELLEDPICTEMVSSILLFPCLSVAASLFLSLSLSVSLSLSLSLACVSSLSFSRSLARAIFPLEKREKFSLVPSSRTQTRHTQKRLKKKNLTPKSLPRDKNTLCNTLSNIYSFGASVTSTASGLMSGRGTPVETPTSLSTSSF